MMKRNIVKKYRNEIIQGIVVGQENEKRRNLTGSEIQEHVVEIDKTIDMIDKCLNNKLKDMV